MSKKNSTSSRHHYVPQFYIKGFCNAEGMLYVYDKQKDIIYKNPRPPKSLFFERDRNLMEIDGQKNSILEDEYYLQIDDHCAKTITLLREEPNLTGILSLERALIVRYFIQHLFWRIPYSDPFFNDLFKHAKIKYIGKEGERALDYKSVQELKSDENYKKLERSIMAIKLMQNWIDSKPTERLPDKLFDEVNPMFLLSDSPLVFKEIPKTVQEIVTSEFFFPLSYRRMYCTVRDHPLYFDDGMSLAYNAIQIAQAKKYVCAPTLEILEAFVEYYRILKETNSILEAKAKLFKNVLPLTG